MELIKKYFSDLSSKQIEQLEKLEELYVYWNGKINLISRKDIDNFYERHVLHSLSIAKMLYFRAGTQILDVGTGGGFPGIPLSIFFPRVEFTLIDSIGKKIKVVNEVAKSLELQNVKGLHINSKNVKDKFDFVVSRAVSSFDNFMPLVRGRIKREEKNSLPNGILYLKGGDLKQELKRLKKRAIVCPVSNFFEEDFFNEKYIVHITV